MSDTTTTSSPNEQLTKQPQGLTGQTTLGPVLKAFREHMRMEGFTQNTIKAFASDVRLLHKYVKDKPIGEIDTDTLNKFLNWLLHERNVPCSPKSYSRRVTTLKVLFGWLDESGVLPVDPSEAVVQHSVTSPLPEIPTEVEVERALTVTAAWREGETIEGEPRKKDVRPHALLTLLLQTAGKKGEIKGILLKHIEREDPNAPEIFIRYNTPRLQYKERKIAVEPSWLPIADEYIEQYGLTDELFTCTARNLEYILRDVGDEAGLERGLLSFENLRWAAALDDFKKQVEPEIIREKLGLSKITWRETESKLAKLWEQQIEEATTDDSGAATVNTEAEQDTAVENA